MAVPGLPACSVCLLLMILLIADDGLMAVTMKTSSPTGAGVNRLVKPPGWKRYGSAIDCQVTALDHNIDFSVYTGRTIYRISVYCDKSSFLSSRLSDDLFYPLRGTLEFIFIYDCYFANISRYAFRELNGLRRLWIIGRSNYRTDTSSLDISNVSNLPQFTNSEIALLPATSICNTPIILLPKGIFSDLSNLTRLKLKMMRLNNSIWHQVENLKYLNYLDLSSNNLTTININSISKLNHLKGLFLRDNYLHSILNGTFEDLSKLERLDLSSNAITAIECDALKGLNKLNALHLSRNSIDRIEINTFKGLIKLSNLDVSKNSIKTVQIGTFKGLGLLKALDLSSNNIEALEMGTFKGQSNIYTLNLSRNSIKAVKMDTFLGLSTLYSLDLSKNRIRTITMGAFKGLIKLGRLLLAENQVTVVAYYALSHLTLLHTLDLSHNNIDTLPNFPSTLTSLNLKSNDIITVDHTSFAGLPYLMTLDLSHNRARECTKYKIPDNLVELNLSSNELSVAVLNLTASLRYADLKNNQLESITLYGLKEYRYARWSSGIYLAGNGGPFQCVCNLEPLHNASAFNNDRGNYAQYHIWNFTAIDCIADNISGITEISTTKFLCNTSCHSNCTCYHWRYRQNNINIVDCLNAGLTLVPANISVLCTILDLSGNMFQSLSPENFDSLFQLVELYLSSCNITKIKKGTFQGLSYLTKLDLGNNNIRQLDSGIFKGLSRLSVLNLSLNMIHEIEGNAFKFLDKLKYLEIAGNEFKTLTTSNIDSMYKLASLTLSNNPWSCDCTFLKKIIRLTTKVNILDLSDIICFTPNKTKYHIVRIFIPEFCPDDPDTDKPREASPSDIALYSIVGVTVLGIICFAVVFRNREFFRLWFFMKCGWKSAVVESDEMDRAYDAFVSYSHADEAFVTRELMPRLEEPRQGRLGYNLCVHFRDFPVGGHIPETILDAVNDSKRVIMILSDNFLSSEWCNYEFQAAHHQLLTEWKNRIIMVLLHDLNPDLLDRQLKLYLSTRTYVKVGDPLFWDKIEYAMPERRQPNEEDLHAENVNNQVDNMEAESDENTSDDEQLLD